VKSIFTLGGKALLVLGLVIAVFKCNYDKALERLDTAIAEGGFAAELAVLEKVVVLLDAGREAEAEEVLAERNENVGASAEDIVEARKSIDETLEGLRAEREQQTGSRTCP